MLNKTLGEHGRESVRKAQDMTVVFMIKKFRLSQSQSRVFPEAGSTHQTLRLVSKGISVLVPKGTEQQPMANGDPAPRGSPQPSPAELEGDFGPSLAGEAGCPGDAQHSFTHEYFQPHTQN